MVTRFQRIAAPLALSLLASAQAFAVTLGSSSVSGVIPSVAAGVHVPGICYTKRVSNVPNFGTVVEITRRACFAGEKPGSVFVLPGGTGVTPPSF